jgi:hypothetical protein
MPVAGRSLRAPPSAHSVLTRFGIPPAVISKRRLVGTGSPLLPWRVARVAARMPVFRVTPVQSSQSSSERRSGVYVSVT